MDKLGNYKMHLNSIKNKIKIEQKELEMIVNY
jgi:hypothetical protein